MDGKSGFWGVIIAAIITGGISYYIYYDNKKVEEKKEKDMIAKIEKEKRNSIARIYIDELFLPSIYTKLDSVLYLKLSNDSFNNAKNLDIKINFGGTNVNNCEIQPNLNTKGTLDNSIFKYSVKELKIKDSIYFYCTLSNPIFDNILINGSNLKNDIKL
ncbi:MAG: hypothetical protein HRT42_03555, partial [Campylobacteraceae bacterium]|nr:hypothetical protein [Campylobacteraceae bacterium]